MEKGFTWGNSNANAGADKEADDFTREEGNTS